MKINPNYKLREIAGETIIVNQGVNKVNMTRLISLNKSATLLYRSLAEKSFTLDDVARVLMNTYGIDENQALTDAEKWIHPLKESGIIEDE